jgi:hypothetical protein
MTPIRYDGMKIWQGKTFERPLFFKDKNEAITRLDGYTARMQLRESAESEVVQLELSTENDRIIIDPDAGSVTLFVTDEDTALLTPGTYKYDLELETASGRVYAPMYGKIKVIAEVTRAQ